MPNPIYVFLDQNHWIYLAKEFWGKPHNPLHKGIAERLLAGVQREQVRFPLNVIHLIEHRREKLAHVFELFGRGWFFAPWSDIIAIEISRALVQTFHATDIPAPPNIFGQGFLSSVGRGERASLNGLTRLDAKDMHWLSAQPGALLDLLTFPNDEGRRRQRQRISEMDDENVTAAETLRAARKSLDKALWRRMKLVNYTYEFQNLIAVGLLAIGRSFDEFIALGPEGLTEFWSRVPSMDVDCELTLYRDRQWPRTIQANDVRDLGHLALAIPYCDIILVERFWARAIQETRLANKYGTTVCTDLTELVAALG